MNKSSYITLLLILACDAPAEGGAEAARQDAADVESSAGSEAVPSAAPTAINPRLLRRFQPLARAQSPGEPLVNLGRMLFFDPRLSRDRDLSCNSCHRLDNFGVDSEPTSIGADGKRGRRNSPTVFNAAGHASMFWDGRAATAEEQATGPILNPAEMAMPDAAAVVARLTVIPGYVEAFTKAFPGDANAISLEHVGVAIGAFERGLYTPSRWDRFLEGDTRALDEAEVVGFKVFSDVGCVSCHTGEYLGGSTFQKAGLVREWPNQADQGRFEVTGVAADKMMFKVPTLRNIRKTAPYFHDGSVRMVEEAVTMMGRHQLDVELTESEVASIVSWFDALTGEAPTNYADPPTLPAD